jgi:hypothetical protein
MIDGGHDGFGGFGALAHPTGNRPAQKITHRSNKISPSPCLLTNSFVNIPHAAISSCPRRGRLVLLHPGARRPLHRSSGAAYRSPAQSLCNCAEALTLRDDRGLRAAGPSTCNMGAAPRRCRFFPALESDQDRVLSRVARQRGQKSEQIPETREGIWQRRFWEHAIRDERDLSRHIDYIHFNPVKHGYVSRACDWPHSSFHRYVAREFLPLDWGGDARKPTGAFGE